ncbi:copper homeostasis CutC domain-containing protein [Cercophora samala]|uniref:Copper homeostasis protein cutC homolog n=1 Tax=Cercophora samala TaxID=330535 RepID=A0AA40D5P0_9PEZI|nr:copper homeostasis CutC domain-containing protein [Cercophora samala]
MSAIEIAIFGPNSGVAAVRAVGQRLNGKTRLELNRSESYGQDGLTPFMRELEQLDDSLHQAGLKDVPVRIMIRPRGGNFIYSDAEFEKMKSDLLEFKGSQCMREKRGDGFVFGILKESSSDAQRLVVDRERTAELRGLAGPDFQCVFHRAFDQVIATARDDNGWKTELEWLEMQKMAVLTSGGRGNASNNAKVLRKVLDETSLTGQELIVGGGVRSETLESMLNDMGGLGRIFALTSLRGVGMVLHSSFLTPMLRDNIMFFDVLEARKFKTTLDVTTEKQLAKARS